MEFPNQHETKVITFLLSSGVASIRDIAKGCGWIKSLGTVKADSRVRNALRRPYVKAHVVKKARGTYEITAKGRKFAESATADAVQS